jgi:hypothetical protein
MAKSKRQRRGGRAEKTTVINFRIRPETLRLLKAAAEKSGRTLSAEAEHQLWRALADMGTGPTHAMMATIAKAIDALVRLRGDGRDASATWTTDPYLYDQAVRVVESAFAMFKPKGEPPTGEALFDAGGPNQGTFFVAATLREMQLVDPNKPFGEQSPYERWLNRLRADLGPLADKPVIWGETAAQAREKNKVWIRVREELVKLSRKAAQEPDAMTPQEAARLAELRTEVAKIRSGGTK